MSTTAILEVNEASSRAHDGTILLDEVSFSVEPGWLVAVVGPTGAGKTSLAKALLGQLPLSSGTVRITHSEHGGLRSHGRVAGVPQDDATHAQLSLRRTLEHAAALRTEAGRAERQRSVDAVLGELGLTGRADTRLDALSGGERKRANVAVELLGRPDLLVLDEPTAGLDPAFERSVFASLRSLADRGHTIVAITHSVRALEVCDRVLFLAPGGVVAFFGTPPEAEAYFAWNDPADAYAALATEPPSQWKARFTAHQSQAMLGSAWTRARLVGKYGTGATSGPRLATTRHGRSGHLRTLLRRALDLATSDRRSLALSLAAGPVLGLLLWAILPGAMLQRPLGSDGITLGAAPRAATFGFFVAITVTWLGAAGAAREVVKERHILRRELGAGVSIPTYLTGKAVFLSGITAVQVVPLTAIAMVRQGLPARSAALGFALVEMAVIVVLVGMAAVATGLVVSSWASSSEKAMTALPVILIAQLALAGPWAEDRGGVIDVLHRLIPATWASSAIRATVVDDASSWWLAVLGLSGLIVVQLAGALVLLRRNAPRFATGRPGRPVAISLRWAATRPASVRLVPAGLALVLALAAGLGAVSRQGATVPPSQALAAPRANIDPPAPAPTAGVVVPRQAVPVAVASPTTTRPRPTTTVRAPQTTLVRATPIPVAPPPTLAQSPAAGLSPTSTITSPVVPSPSPPTTRPPAATAPQDPFLLSAWILQQIFRAPAGR